MSDLPTLVQNALDSKEDEDLHLKFLRIVRYFKTNNEIPRSMLFNYEVYQSEQKFNDYQARVSTVLRAIVGDELYEKLREVSMKYKDAKTSTFSTYGLHDVLQTLPIATGAVTYKDINPSATGGAKKRRSLRRKKSAKKSKKRN